MNGRIILIRSATDAKAPWHIARPGSDRGVCGVTPGSFAIEHGIDARVVQHAGRPVCVNCLDRLTRGNGSGIVQVHHDERSTVTTSTERKKAASTALLDPASYADQPLDRLRQERSTVNNRLSGIGTQIKRFTLAGDAAKLAAAEGRRDDLTARRQQIAEAITAAKAKAPAEQAPATPPAKTRTKAKTTSRRKTKTASRRKTASTAKKAGTRKTSSRSR